MRIHRLLVAALLGIFLARIALTYRVFNDTSDEAFHLVAGLEYWQRGRYQYEVQHPPLARLVVAALPYFFGGLRIDHHNTLWDHGPWNERDVAFYWRTLSLARAGNLLFAVLLFAFVYRWSLLLHGPNAALAACALLACCPNVLAHAGLATLDLAAAATVLMTAFFLWRWVERPAFSVALAAGTALGAAVLSKFSALAFLPPAALLFFLTGWFTRQRRPRLAHAAVAASAAGLVIWAGYRFEVHALAPPGHRYIGKFATGQQSGLPARLSRAIENRTLPAPGFWQGVIDLTSHDQEGHPAYLLGRWSQRGWWYYFPIAVLLKTTLPLLVLSALVLVRRGPPEELYPIWLTVVVLVVSMAASLNIGIRHVLVIYPLLAILASGLFRDPGRWRVAALALLAWHAAESLAAHPDYLPYFNQIARGREHHFLVDSNLDWGQDLHRLARHLRQNHIDDIQLSYVGQTNPDKFGIPHRALDWEHPRPGWVGISVQHLMGSTTPWRFHIQPSARVGKSIWLYYREK